MAHLEAKDLSICEEGRDDVGLLECGKIDNMMPGNTESIIGFRKSYVLTDQCSIRANRGAICRLSDQDERFETLSHEEGIGSSP
jgi:hypothetical protein